MEGVTFPLAFLAGIAAFASPCFLPLVPALLAYLAGDSRQTRASFASLAQVDRLPESGFISRQRVAAPVQPVARSLTTVKLTRRWQALLYATVFVLAFSCTFVGLWAGVALLGGMVAKWSHVLRILGGLVLIVVGLHGLNLLSFGRLDATAGSRGRWSGQASVGKSAVLGVAFAVGWSPCIGPVLGAIIALAVSTASTWHGLALMVAFCAGMGAPLLILAGSIDATRSKMEWITRKQRTIRIVTSVLMLIVGLLMVTDLLAPLSGITWLPW